MFCLEHRSYGRHQCPNANKNDVTVVICPLCAKGVRLIPAENPNITWESHVNTECDPSNYDKVTKKKKCPVPRCKEILTFSNTVRCKDCATEHCLKHRFGPDHSCPGPKKQATAFQFSNFLSTSRNRSNARQAPAASSSSSSWGSAFLRAASSVRATAEAGISKLSSEFSQASVRESNSNGSSNRNSGYGGSGTGLVEQCPQCNMRFKSITDLVNHVENIHERNGVMKSTIDVCPRCNKGFRDPIALVEHVERDHRGTSKA